MFGMSRGFSCEKSVEKKREKKIEVEMRKEKRLYLIAEKIAGLKIQAIQVMNGRKRIKLKADCPKCFHKLTLGEILEGYTDDPVDYYTTCPLVSCGHRFPVTVIYEWRGNKYERPMYCAAQVLPKLKGLEGLTPEIFERDHGGLYNSVIFHYGSLKSAYEKLDLEYKWIEFHLHRGTLTDRWKRKIKKFIGKLPDEYIASVFHFKKEIIEQYRIELQIGEFSKEDILLDG